MADYTYFMFDGVSSSKYNLYIQNNGEDLSYPSQPGFENQIVSPLYQGTNYLAGVNKKERTFSFNCWADSLNRDSVRAMLDWLSPDKVSELVLSYNPNYYYKAKLASVTDFKHMAINGDETSNYEFQLTFVTIGDFAAISRTDFVINQTTNPVNTNPALLLNPDNLAPSAIWDTELWKPVPGDRVPKFKMFNYASEPMYLITKLNNAESFTIDKNSITYYSYSKLPAANFVADSKYGFVKIGDVLAETVDGVTATTNLGAMSIESGRPEVLYTTISGTPTTTVTLNYTNHILENTNTDNLYMIIQDGDYGVELLTQEMTEAERQLYITESINEQYNKINKDGSNSEIDTLTFDPTPASALPLVEGQMRWNPADHTMDIGMAFGATLQLGQESHIYVRNDGPAIAEGDAVYVSGVQGQTLAVTKAIATSAATAYVIAVATTPIPKNGHGYVTTYGLVRGIDMNGFLEGQALWLSATTAGKYTNTPPAYNFAQSFIGWVAKKGHNGSLFVFPKYLERSSEVPLTDAANHFTATNVDGALEELYQNKVDKVAGKELITSTVLTDLTDGGDTILHKHSASNITNTPSGNISATTVQGAINELDTEKADKLFATNLVTNGDFNNGTTGWFSSGSSSLTAITGGIKLVGDGSQNYFEAYTHPAAIAVNNNDKVYIYGKLKSIEAASSIVIRAYNSTESSADFASPTANTVYTLSGVVSYPTAGTYTLAARAIYDDPASANGKQLEVYRMMAINLTATFGAGKEPSAIQMDNMLSTFPNSWFNGTAELVSIANLAQLKADKTQEAWITPTLLNGATGTLKYMKDQMGFVHFKGTVVVSNATVSFVVVPTGYRPAETNYFSAPRSDSATAIQKVTIFSAGSIWPAATGTLYLDSFTYRAEA